MQKIYNVESLETGDLKTYEDLEDVVTLHKNKPEYLEYKLLHVGNKEELERVFKHILEEVKKNDIKPLLHFDMHGYEDGKKLKSGQLIDWEDISDHLIEINKATNMKLFICAGACFGVGMVKITNFMKRAPYSILVGPNREVEAQYISEFYKGLYNCYLDTGEVEKFLDETDLIPDKFSAIWIQTAFDMLFDIETSKSNGSYHDAFVHWVQDIFNGDRHQYTNDELLNKFDK